MTDDQVADRSVALVVTSPPYPMIEMWDEIFSKQNPSIGKALKSQDGNSAFELMNKELDTMNKVLEIFLKKLMKQDIWINLSLLTTLLPTVHRNC